ncbi:MAG: 30S ribosomal protein S6 [Candidatus Krumholzibacteriia bacterium]
MRKYECMFILRADQPDQEMESRVEQVGAIVARNNGEMTHRNHWGVRKLAYEIDHENKGNYMLLQFRSEAGAVAEIDRYLRLDDKVLRHLVVVDEEWAERNRAAMAKRRRVQEDTDEAS